MAPSAPEAAFTALSRAEFDELMALADTNHVVVRACTLLETQYRAAGDEERAGWAASARAAEQERIRYALGAFHHICSAFQTAGLDCTVIKTLDHWPDFGSDLDLFSGAAPDAVLRVMQQTFGAELEERSWGDRLAQKWNFKLPELPELVEFHVERLGQTGEQTAIARTLAARSRRVEVEGMSFPVAHVSDRIMISTLQRMYRHFYFRLCDVLDSATLLATGAVDFDDLQKVATRAGIWQGVSAYLVIVANYVKQYGGPELVLPASVRSADPFAGVGVYYARSFLRVPILPQSAGLYARQWASMLGKGAIGSTGRLSLLPWLATAAWMEQKRTGSDKGIW